MSDSDQKYYDLVAEELEYKNIKIGVWTRAIAETGDEGPKAKAVYIKLRVAELKHEKESPSVVHQVMRSHNQADRKIEVGGWLLFFCVALVIMVPLYALVKFVPDLQDMMPYYHVDRYVKHYVIANFIYNTAVIVYGMVTGVLIWMGHPKGRAIARCYLGIYYVVSFAYMLHMVILHYRYTSTNALIAYYIGVFFWQTIGFIVWWLYFNKSQRVKLTYGEELAATK